MTVYRIVCPMGILCCGYSILNNANLMILSEIWQAGHNRQHMDTRYSYIFVHNLYFAGIQSSHLLIRPGIIVFDFCSMCFCNYDKICSYRPSPVYRNFGVTFPTTPKLEFSVQNLIDL